MKNPIYHSIKKYLRINLTKEMKDAYTKCYNTFMTEIEEDTDKCREISYFLTERINIVKMSILLKAIYKINSNDIFHIKRMAILKFMWNHKQPK